MDSISPTDAHDPAAADDAADDAAETEYAEPESGERGSHLVPRRTDYGGRYQVRITATPKQTEWLSAVFSGKYGVCATGGAIRGTKTWMGFLALVLLAKKYPRSRWVITRDVLPTMRKTTIPSFNGFKSRLGAFVGDLNHSTWTWTCENESQILVVPESIVSDPQLENWRGLEANGFLGEEANELQQQTLSKMIERAGTWIIPPDSAQLAEMNAAQARGEDPRPYGPEQPPPLVMLTFNPTDNWVRDLFYEPFARGGLAALPDGFYYLPTTAKDNPFLPESWWKNTERLKTIDPAAYARFVLGIWGDILDPWQLISPAWLAAARNVEPTGDQPRGLGVDVAVGTGPNADDAAIARRIGNVLGITPREIMHGVPTDQIADRAMLACAELQIPAHRVSIDTVGVGRGTYDFMRRNGKMVRAFIAGARPIPRLGEPLIGYANLRSQAAWEFREGLRLGQWRIEIPDERLWQRFYAEAKAFHFELKHGRTIELEPKAETAKRLGGKSPDVFEAIMQAAFDWPIFEEADYSEPVSSIVSPFS